jgi:MFS family permease
MKKFSQIIDSILWIKERQTLIQSLLLGLVYAIQLFSYQLFILVLPSSTTNLIKDGLALSLHICMLTGSVFWAWLMLKKWDMNTVLKRSLVVSAVALLWQSILLLDSADPWSFYLSRGLFGFGFSAGLAIALTLVTERLPAYVRTRSAAVVMAVGMLGPVVAVVLPNKVDWGGIYLFFAGLLLLLPLFFSLPKDGTTFGQWEEKQDYTVWQFATKFPTSRIFWSCVAVGLCVSLFSDLLTLIPKMYSIKSGILVFPTSNDSPVEIKMPLEIIFLMRYVGMSIGCIIISFWSIAKRSRKSIVKKLMMLQGVAITLLLLPAFPELGITIPYNVFIIFVFISGFLNSSWLILLLNGSELFGFQNRRIANLLIVGFTRAGAFFLVLFNNLGSKDWYLEFPEFILFYCLMFISIGLVAAPFLNDRFEAESIPADFKDRPFDGENDRKIFVEGLGEKNWMSTNFNIFTEEAKKQFHTLFAKHFGNTIYFSGLFLSAPNNKHLFQSGFDKIETAKEEVDQGTYNLYNHGLDGEEMRGFHKVIQRIILYEGGKATALTNWMMAHEDAELAGTLLWYGGPGQLLPREYEYEQHRNLHTFNLAKIRFKPAFSDRTFTTARAEIPTDTEGNVDVPRAALWLEKLCDQVEFDTGAWTKFTGEKTDKNDRNDWEYGIMLNVLLHRLDCDKYAPGTYYAYYIKSFNTFNQLRGTLAIKSAIPIGVDHLGSIRNLLTFVMLQRGAAILQLEKLQIIRTERHTHKGELLMAEKQLDKIDNWFERIKNDLPDKQQDQSEFRSSFYNAYNTIFHLRKVSDYNVYLEKMLANAIDHNSDKDKEKYRSESQVEMIDLKTDILDELSKAFKGLEMAKIKEKENKDVNRSKNIVSCFQNLDNSINETFKGQNFLIEANHTGLRIILVELLKNAFENAHPDEPIVLVSGNYNLDKDIFHLHIINNWPDNYKDDKPKHEKLKITVTQQNEFIDNYGLCTIFRILKAGYLSKSKGWGLICEMNGRTDMCLTIPISTNNQHF